MIRSVLVSCEMQAVLLRLRLSHGCCGAVICHCSLSIVALRGTGRDLWIDRSNYKLSYETNTL